MIKNKVTVLFFGMFKDIMGDKRIEIPINSPISVQSFLDELLSINQLFSKIFDYLKDSSLKQPVFIFLNGQAIQKPFTIELNPGDEIAFLPPVGGG